MLTARTGRDRLNQRSGTDLLPPVVRLIVPPLRAALLRQFLAAASNDPWPPPRGGGGRGETPRTAWFLALFLAAWAIGFLILSVRVRADGARSSYTQAHGVGTQATVLGYEILIDHNHNTSGEVVDVSLSHPVGGQSQSTVHVSHVVSYSDGQKIYVLVDPQEPGYAELPGEPQDTTRGLLAAWGLAVACTLGAIYFCREAINLARHRHRDIVTLLRQLSFDGRPDLGYGKVVLVEGKAELRALMQFLRFYQKEHKVLMIPLYGTDRINGDSEAELTALLRIGSNVRYLIDSERAAAGEPLSKSRQAFVDLCERLGIDGHVLERRALVNYLTDSAVKRAFGSTATAFGPYDKKGPGQNWPKANNWRAASQMTKSDIDGTDLGAFLEKL